MQNSFQHSLTVELLGLTARNDAASVSMPIRGSYAKWTLAVNTRNCVWLGSRSWSSLAVETSARIEISCKLNFYSLYLSLFSLF